MTESEWSDGASKLKLRLAIWCGPELQDLPPSPCWGGGCCQVLPCEASQRSPSYPHEGRNLRVLFMACVFHFMDLGISKTCSPKFRGLERLRRLCYPEGGGQPPGN